jgi:hypothetical protein
MPAMHVAIQAEISLSAFGIRSGVGRVSSDRASHAVPRFVGLAIRFRYCVTSVLYFSRCEARLKEPPTLGLTVRCAADFRDAHVVCGDPSLGFALCVWTHGTHRYEGQRWGFVYCALIGRMGVFVLAGLVDRVR